MFRTEKKTQRDEKRETETEKEREREKISYGMSFFFWLVQFSTTNVFFNYLMDICEF